MTRRTTVVTTANNGGTSSVTLAFVPNSPSHTEFIPWHVTRNIELANTALNRMVDSLPDSSPLKTYILENCSSNLVPLTGNTGLPTNLLASESTAVNSNTHSLNKGASVATSYPNSGIYAFIDPETGNMNVGSCTKFYTRLVNHFNDSLNPEDNRPLYARARELGGLEYFDWNVAYTQNSHETIFFSQHPELASDGSSRDILRAMTQYELYTREQALISYYGTDIPGQGLNGRAPVSFTWLNWNSSWSSNSTGRELSLYYHDTGLPVTENTLSLVRVSDLLGVHRLTLSHIINVADSPIRAPNLNDQLINVVDHSQGPRLPRITPYERLALSDFTPDGLSPEEIPANAVYVYAKGIDTLLGVCPSPSIAAGYMDLPYYMITRNINKAIYVAAGVGAISTMSGLSLSFWQNPLCVGNDKKVLDTYHGVTSTIPSVDEANRKLEYRPSKRPLQNALKKAGGNGIMFNGHHIVRQVDTLVQYKGEYMS